MILVSVGGSGSLGRAILGHQELLKEHGISKIIVISRDEFKQSSLMQSYTGSIPLKCRLGDVCDKERMQFALKDAHYVIHSAAQKQIDKFVLDLKQGYRTNIIGTQNVADAFLESKNAISGVFLSTDKAFQPITSYGVSKLAASHLWLWYNTFQKNVKYGVVCYGNVFGSRGSVIERWTKLAIQKKPLPLTDSECTRFFITLSDASRFVLNSLFNNKCSNDTPKMKSCFMRDLADTIWRYHNGMSSITQIEDIGMRGIEKVHEDLASQRSDLADKFTSDELLEMYDSWFRYDSMTHR